MQANISALEGFGAAASAWFTESFDTPTEVQRLGWPLIQSGKHALLSAPTGSGKTLAAFLWAIDRLHQAPQQATGVRVLYISPLKALVYDVERNLRAPLAGIDRTADRLGLLGSSTERLRVDVRTGDTPQRERRQQARNPAPILVTTPESLFLLLTARARAGLRHVETVIIDEVHALAPTKRGSHLALSLERLADLCERDPQRIGLSATVRPLELAAAFVGGDRVVEILDTSQSPSLDLRVTVPVPDMQRVPRPEPTELRGGPILRQLYQQARGEPPPERGIWAAVYPALLEEVKANTATIIFVNSRGLCERLCQRLNDLAGEDLLRAHHGSVSHVKRAEIEEALKSGQLRGIVATSSLELGIDMGAVDRVLLVESPGSVARGLQRVGRAGHGVAQLSVGRIFPKFRGDLLESAVIAQRMVKGEIEAIRLLRNPLDVLAQHIVAMVVDRPCSVDDVAVAVRRAQPYRELSQDMLISVIEMLSGAYASGDFAQIRPLISWDRSTQTLSPRRGAALTVRLNAGTIPDRGNYLVTLGSDGGRLGELDEEMVFETKPGDTVLLGASSWRVEEITRDRVIVSPAPGEPGRLPFWRGDGPGRPLELGRAVGAFVRELDALPAERSVAWLQQHAELDAYAAANLTAYVREQRTHTGTVPTDRSITVERFRDELGDWRVCVLTPFGARVHAPWAMALQHLLSSRAGFDVQVMYTDDGIVLRFADATDLPEINELLPDAGEIEDLVTEQLAGTALFASLFRENAARALLMPKRSGGGRQPLWALRLKAQNLLSTVTKYPAFPIVLETYRQALSDVFDLAELQRLLRDINSRRIDVVEVETPRASPFARSLVFAYVAAYLYEQDAPLAERKVQALTLDRHLLAELLGQAELRELIDPDVLVNLEHELQHLGADRSAGDADDLHDLLRRLGDLTAAEIQQRSRLDAEVWLRDLHRQRRAIASKIAGEQRWIAAEDAGLYRDALGAVHPPGLPDRFLEPQERPLERLLQRFARVHGPFVSSAIAGRFGLRSGQVDPILQSLEARGELVRGEIRPGGSQLDWCDPEVLRRLRRRTLAKLRNEIAPVDAATLGRFLPDWQGVVGVDNTADRSSQAQLLTVVAQLEGIPLAWSTLANSTLPLRVPGLRVEELDLLAANGSVVWVGQGALGARDGRIVLYRRSQLATLYTASPAELERTGVQTAILDRLAKGACFLTDLEDAAQLSLAGLRPEEFRQALWDLVWAGLITNDTFAPLRSLSGPRRRGQDAPSGGRWSCVSDLLHDDLADTERHLARTQMLLERYGLVSREVAYAERLPGGFGPVYQVLKRLEDTGRVRRGYFVEGLSGAQFAHPGALDRLRAARIDEPPLDGYKRNDAFLLPATDPANPYGAVLPWPPQRGEGAAQPKRVAGAWVVMVAGQAALWLNGSGRHLLTFAGVTASELLLALATLHGLPRLGRKAHWVVEKIDGVAAHESSLSELMLRSGYTRDYRGITRDPLWSPDGV